MKTIIIDSLGSKEIPHRVSRKQKKAIRKIEKNLLKLAKIVDTSLPYIQLPKNFKVMEKWPEGVILPIYCYE